MFFLNLFSLSYATKQIDKISLKPGVEMDQAEIYVWRGLSSPKKVLVLAPGCNGNGGDWIEQKVWLDFARENCTSCELMGPRAD